SAQARRSRQARAREPTWTDVERPVDAHPCERLRGSKLVREERQRSGGGSGERTVATPGLGVGPRPALSQRDQDILRRSAGWGEVPASPLFPGLVRPQAPPQPPPPAPRPSVALPPELARVLPDYETAWGSRDAAALARLFAEDGFVLPGGKPPIRGRA